jgi:cellulase/cellobiase CelA1
MHTVAFVEANALGMLGMVGLSPPVSAEGDGMRITPIATCVTFTALLIGAVPATASTDLLEQAATPDFPLVTSGNQILDADGDPVIWQGVVLTDDWTTVHADKMTLLTELIDQQMTRQPDPLPAPSPDPAPPPNDDAADPRQVRVRLLTVSTWDSGSCHVLKVVNRGTEELSTWRATLRLAKGTTVTSAWGATATTRGRKATLRPESWVRMIPAGERSTDIGLCVGSPRKPSLLRIRT